MKKFNLLFLVLVLMTSCSTPKYTYYFKYHDYNSGKKKSPAPAATVAVEPAREPLAIDEETLTASAKESEPYVAPAPTMTKEEAIAKIKSMSKEERKELKKEIKRYVKENRSDMSRANGGRYMDNDVKVAAIFGAIGIVLLIIGGDVLYILGAVALIIALYFLIKWLARQ